MSNTYEYMRKRVAMARIALADKIESDFISKHGGLASYIVACSREEAGDAVMDLTTADPTDAKEIQRLQNIVHRHTQHMQWLAGAAERGEEAWSMLKEEEQEAIANAIDPKERED